MWAWWRTRGRPQAWPSPATAAPSSRLLPAALWSACSMWVLLHALFLSSHSAGLSCLCKIESCCVHFWGLPHCRWQLCGQHVPCGSSSSMLVRLDALQCYSFILPKGWPLAREPSRGLPQQHHVLLMMTCCVYALCLPQSSSSWLWDQCPHDICLLVTQHTDFLNDGSFLSPDSTTQRDESSRVPRACVIHLTGIERPCHQTAALEAGSCRRD